TWYPENHRWSLAAKTYTVSVGSPSRDIHPSGEIGTEGDRLVPPLTRPSTIEQWREHNIGGPGLAQVRGGMQQLVSIPDELLRMADSMPLAALATFELGVTEEMIDMLVADVERRRLAAIERGEILGCKRPTMTKPPEGFLWGRRDRGSPDRGQQHQQQCVGTGTCARSTTARAQRRRG